MTRVLVLGGSWFLGRTVVEDALSRGWDVTTFRRGQSGHDVPGVELIRGDRTDTADLARLARSGPWDAVIDTSGFVPRETLHVARVLEPVAGRFVFVSTVSVYQGWPTEPLSEQSTVLECPSDAGPDYGYDGDPGPSTYGFTKAGCERAVLETFGVDRAAILRPGVILGPWEYVGRLPWWLRRMRRGGRVLAPGQPGRHIQPVDVRDVAGFALTMALDGAGTFNVTADGQDTMETFLAACKDIVDSKNIVGSKDTGSKDIGSTARLEWIDERWLVEQGVKQWTELPLWRTYAGTWAVDSSAGRAVGLTTRPIRNTVADTWAWMQAETDAVEHERASEQGISPDKEAAILGLWDAQERDVCGP